MTPANKPKHVGYATVWIPVPLRERIDQVLAAGSKPGLRPNRQAYIAEVLRQHLDAVERAALAAEQDRSVGTP